MAATEGRVRFHARVAGRVLAIVQRELEAGDGPARAHAARLEALGFADDAAWRPHPLRLDDRWDEVAGAVRATVADKLAVANPDDGRRARPSLPAKWAASTNAPTCRELAGGARPRAALRAGGHRHDGDRVGSRKRPHDPLGQHGHALAGHHELHGQVGDGRGGDDPARTPAGPVWAAAGPGPGTGRSCRTR